MYRSFVKRPLDFVLALGGLIIISPLLLVLVILVYLQLGSPIIFRQQRPGLHGKPFIIYKFRTMVDAHDAEGNLLSDANRLTPFGQFLRRTSLDEFPELLNVLKGDMSLVGPRPLMPQYLQRYTMEQARRHDVRPGITGWAQVNGRNSTSWENRFELDLWYVNNLSFWVDIRILTATMITVFKREGISAQNHVTMPEFMGTNSAGLHAIEDKPDGP